MVIKDYERRIMGTGAAAATKEAKIEDLHLKTRKEIEEFGLEEVLRRWVVSARVYRRNSSPLADGMQKEANIIAQLRSTA